MRRRPSIAGFTRRTQTCCSCRVVSRRRVSRPERKHFCHKRFNQLSQSRMSGDCQASRPSPRCASPCSRRKALAERAVEVITVSPFSIAAAMDRGSCIPCFIPQRMAAAPLALRVYTQCMRRIAALVLLCVFGTVLPSATVVALAAPQQLVPMCCRAHGAHSCLMGVSTSAGAGFRQAGLPVRPHSRPNNSVSLSAYFSSRIVFGLVTAHAEQQLIADEVASSVLLRSAPRGPPTSSLL